jgi:hypothetical protein
MDKKLQKNKCIGAAMMLIDTAIKTSTGLCTARYDLKLYIKVL